MTLPTPHSQTRHEFVECSGGHLIHGRCVGAGNCHRAECAQPRESPVHAVQPPAPTEEAAKKMPKPETVKRQLGILRELGASEKVIAVVESLLPPRQPEEPHSRLRDFDDGWNEGLEAAARFIESRRIAVGDWCAKELRSLKVVK